jgi:hypothetical protein
MATPALAVIQRASTLLQDTTNIRWPQAELLDWLNDGQREVVLFKPNAYSRNATVALVAGTKQSLPADALALTEVVRNMGTNGTTPGAAIRLVNREILDAQVPNWHIAPASATVKHYVFNPLDPKTFYVYPPQPATGQGRVEIIYPAIPANITLADNILLDDIYVTVLVNYIMHRAYSKDTEYAANAQLASAYYQAFTAMLGSKTASEAATNPNARPAGNPNV